MKILTLFLLALALRASAAPSSPSDDVEVVPSVVGGGQPPRDPEFIYGVLSPFDFLKNFNDVFERMRQHMAVLLSQTRGGIPVDAGLEGKGNTTSVTKVIDGHKVVINETVYSESDGQGGAIFKVRVVDIKPADDTKPNDDTKPADIKPTDDASTQSRDKEESDENLVQTINKREDGIETMDGMETLSGQVFDLSNDIYVNELAQRAGRQPDPDSEWIHDLGNDLKVNKIAEAEGWTHNPDAETFDVRDFPPRPLVEIGNDLEDPTRFDR